ncbi:MAG TPA: hypothetical protein VM120_21305 [Bryobacteraceae bacterium]|nr:hypothetical protein [Bryobacteraceae bacterium]
MKLVLTRKKQVFPSGRGQVENGGSLFIKGDGDTLPQGYSDMKMDQAAAREQVVNHVVSEIGAEAASKLGIEIWDTEGKLYVWPAQAGTSK